MRRIRPTAAPALAEPTYEKEVQGKTDGQRTKTGPRIQNKEKRIRYKNEVTRATSKGVICGSISWDELYAYL